MITAKSGIILACDVETPEELKSLVSVSQHCEGIVGLKIGFLMALRYGLPQVVRDIKAISGLPVIYDHQKAGTDIPAMGGPFAALCAAAGLEGAIVFSHAGPRTLQSFVEALNAEGVVPIVGAAMTHPAFLQSEGGYIADDAPMMAYELAADLGVRYYVIPGNKPDLASRLTKCISSRTDDCSVMMPGIGTQHGEIRSAFLAAGTCRKFAIIGSAIYRAPDPVAAARVFAQEIKDCTSE